MAVAAPARRSQAATAPAPTRTRPPARQPAPRPKRAPAKRAAPKRRAHTAPARAPQRTRRAPARARGQLIPLAVGHTAAAVRGLPDTGLVVRMTRGRAWIGVLGVLLAGIVALNVVTLSFAATAGKVDEANTALSKENSVLDGREAARNSTARIRAEAAAQGLAPYTEAQPRVIDAGPQDVATAASRLAAAAGG